LLAKDGKIEINSIKNKNIHKNTNKENEKGLAHPQPEPVKKIYKTANPSTADEND
jgi:hypothetical protein